ncbi:hypothetical protein IWQ60_011643 [Tieghemiomyces parasiticus]|uniref:N-acetyltransferase domain-containing protein n=1 Tax=Tieghemiomyces parasiticus TaxID=78921 RepID=A0A9W7ZQ32_9FUNG|nr:hypothetical protein IWQ60_011643 [Tieghemiomyces parasiticus]
MTNKHSAMSKRTAAVRNALVIHNIDDLDEFALCKEVRIQVFVEEQGFPLAAELDDLDDRCHHIVALLPASLLTQIASSIATVTTDDDHDAGLPLLPAVDPVASVLASQASESACKSVQAVTPAPYGADGDATATESVVPVGTLRMYEYQPGVAKIGRVAVLPSLRGFRIGQQLMEEAHRVAARQFRCQQVRVHAQYDKAEFYMKCGYEVPDPTQFVEDGYPHIMMVKQL